MAQARRVAGTAMRDAWLAPPLDDDAGMNLGGAVIDLSALAPAEKAFTGAVHAHVSALTTLNWWWTWAWLSSRSERVDGAVDEPTPQPPRSASAQA